MNKKVILLTLASSLLLAGCNPGTSTSSNNTTSEQPTTSQPASSSVDPEAKYQITADEFADYFASLSKVTVTQKNSYSSDTVLICYDGAFMKYQNKETGSSFVTNEYAKVTDSRVVFAMAQTGTAGKITYQASTVRDLSSYHLTSMWQYQRMSFLAMLGVDSSALDAYEWMTDAEFKNCVKTAFAKMTYDSTSHNYIVSAASSSGESNSGSLHFEGKKLLSYSGTVEASGHRYTAEVSFSEIGTTTVSVPSEALPYLTPIKASFYHEDGTTLYGERYVAYLNSTRGPDYVLPSKDPDSGDSENSYVFDGWDHSLTKLTADVSVKPVFTKVANTTLYSIYSGVLTFKSAHSKVANTIIPDGVTEVVTTDGFANGYHYQMKLSDSVTTLTDPDGYSDQILFSVSSGNTAFSIENEALYSADKKKLYSHFGGDEATSFVTNAATEEIEDSAFGGNSNLVSVTLTDSVTSLGAYAFCNSSIQSITLSKKLKTMGADCFAYCRHLTSIVLPDTLTSIPSYCFENCKALTSVTLPNTLTSLSAFCFQSCSALTSIALPDSITKIPNYCFQNCKALTSVTWGSSLTEIDDSAFSGDSKLSSIGEFGSAFKSFGVGAFSGCALTSVDLSKSAITSLSNALFDNNSSLTSISLPSSVILIGTSALANTGLKTFTITKDMGLNGSCFSGCTQLVLTNENTATYTLDSNNNLFSADGKRLIYVSNKEKFVLPSSVTNTDSGAGAGQVDLKELDLSAVNGSLYINQQAFSGDTSLSKIDWPSASGASISLGASSFSLSGLTDLVLPSCVTSVGESAFSNCSDLVSVDMSASPLKAISTGCFTGCIALKNVTLPAGLTSIGGMAFGQCLTLESITLPETLTSIAYNAFAYDIALKNIVIPASVTQISSTVFENDIALSAIYLKATSLPSGYSSGWNGGAPYYLYSESTPASDPQKYWHYVGSVPTVYSAQ
jgi:hypothetical protein